MGRTAGIALRSWLGAAVLGYVMLGLWTATAQLLAGRPFRLHTTFDVSVAFGTIFAIVALLVYVPVFAILAAIRGGRLPLVLSLPLGALFAPGASLAVAMMFRESEDPATLVGWLTYWASHLPEMLLGVIPFLIAGAAFGLIWTLSARTRPRRIEPA